MTYKLTDFQIKINENGNFSSMGGALIITSLFEKFGLRKVIDGKIGVFKGNDAVKYKDSSYIESLVTMQIFGCETVDDMQRIREDGILSNVLVHSVI